MLRTEIKPDNFTYSFMTRAYSEGLDLDGLKVAHGVIVSGLGLDSICSSALVTAYSKLALIDEANKVFHGMPEPDESCPLSLGQRLHGFGLKSYFDSNAHVGSVLVTMYSRFLIATVLAAAAQVANVGSGKEFMRIVFDMDMNYMSRFALL
ncbi:hypothetical protein FNV43_RR20940 [Rhamnella rubrinervis]|uniref:Uncharacterized protein n=1 Tax=Rhamnella rubrinervis TaxID=2594499 RepID=A0A8K0E1A4_9ROSA|nr:hypothetical protein FNV43_RR20940 [Rhamnella rubrinervis]